MKHSTWLGAASLTVLATMSMAQDGGLLVLDYPGFDNPAFHASYVEKHGASPTFSFFSDEEEAFQKVRSGFRADVAEICSGSVPKWTQSGIIQPWDTSRIEEFANLNSELSGNEIGAESEEVYFIPFYFGSTAIAYNPDEVPAEDVASLNVFLNPKYAQRMTLPDNVDDAFALAYLATGVTDWTDVTDDQFNAAADWLREARLAPTILIGHSLGGAAMLSAAGRISEALAVATIGAPAHPASLSQLLVDEAEEIAEHGRAQVKLGERSFRVSKHFLEELAAQGARKTISKLGKALLVFHSPDDQLLSVDNAAALFSEARHPKSFVCLDGADHLLSREQDVEYVAVVLAAWASRTLPSASAG